MAHRPGQPARAAPAAPAPAAQAAEAAPDDITAMITAVIRMVGAACENEGVHPSADKFADVVALAYLDTVDHGGRPREHHVKQLARLLK
jgi:hypothetical protein